MHKGKLRRIQKRLTEGFGLFHWTMWEYVWFRN